MGKFCAIFDESVLKTMKFIKPSAPQKLSIINLYIATAENEHVRRLCNLFWFLLSLLSFPCLICVTNTLHVSLRPLVSSSVTLVASQLVRVLSVEISSYVPF